jgi:dihydropteroate synthase
MRPVFQWNIGDRKLELGRRTLVMGIVNVTPDSFSDGGRFLSPSDAVDQALGMLEEGADIIDIGGESTRPGARVTPEPDGTHNEGSARLQSGGVSGAQCGVSTEEELRRVLPVIQAVKRAVPQAVISIDTYKAEVARQAVNAGAEIVNDVSAFRWDGKMARTVAGMKCGAVLMHMRGRPEQWRELPAIGADELVSLVARELREWASAAEQQGVARDCIALDPGFGFGKNFRENYPLMARLGELGNLGYPLVSGTSRKSFIGRTIGRGSEIAAPTQRLYGTLATITASVLAGAHIVRVHDVTPAIEAAAVADEVVAATTS